LPIVCRSITQQQLTAYANASGDNNPLHLDADFAAGTRFGGIIAHGMLTLAFVSEMMTAALGLRWLSSGSLRVRFKGAAYLGDTVESWGRAVEKSTDEFESFAIGVRNQSTGEDLITGSATVK
jgi:3-hydroxybutyryl-CoA dehydratase